jgi:hypothetical protein
LAPGAIAAVETAYLEEHITLALGTQVMRCCDIASAVTRFYDERALKAFGTLSSAQARDGQAVDNQLGVGSTA